MKKMLVFSVLLMGHLATAGTVTGADNVTLQDPDGSRLVVIGKEITETVFALGQGNHVVGRDLTSAYPPRARQVPDVGYINTVGAEGILSRKPTLVIVNDTMPPTTVQQLRLAGTDVLRLSTPQSGADAVRNIGLIGQALNTPAAAKRLQRTLSGDLQKAHRFVQAQPNSPRALLLVGRPQTGIAAMGNSGKARLYAPFLKALGTKNVADFSGLRKLNGEGLIRMAPDTLLFINRSTGSLEQLGGRQALLNRPEVALTPAGKKGRLFELNDHDITFGPDIGKSLLKVARQIYSQ